MVYKEVEVTKYKFYTNSSIHQKLRFDYESMNTVGFSVS